MRSILAASLLAGTLLGVSPAILSMPASAQTIEIGPGGPSVDMRSRGERRRDEVREDMRREDRREMRREMRRRDMEDDDDRPRRRY